jgi:hypothetical protein
MNTTTSKETNNAERTELSRTDPDPPGSRDSAEAWTGGPAPSGSPAANGRTGAESASVPALTDGDYYDTFELAEGWQWRPRDCVRVLKFCRTAAKRLHAAEERIGALSLRLDLADALDAANVELTNAERRMIRRLAIAEQPVDVVAWLNDQLRMRRRTNGGMK